MPAASLAAIPATTEAALNKLLADLREVATTKQLERVVARGIPATHVLGVPKGEIRKQARLLGPDHQLALALGTQALHELRLLAVWVAEPTILTKRDLARWVDDIWSWDLCDQVARYLLTERDDRFELIPTFVASEALFTRRLGFAGMACCCIHVPERISLQITEQFLTLIKSHSEDKRHHVRQAIVWALVELGKLDDARQHMAIACADELIEDGGGAATIGRQSLKKLELLVETPLRRRLLAANATSKPNVKPGQIK